MNLKLASPATSVLDFGEGTKVRIKNTTVELKGLFLRNDHQSMTVAASTIRAYEKTQDYLTQAGATRSPLNQDIDRYGLLGARIMNLKQQIDDLRAEVGRKSDVIYNQKNEYANLDRRFRDYQNGVIEAAKKQLFAVVDLVVQKNV